LAEDNATAQKADAGDHLRGHAARITARADVIAENAEGAGTEGDGAVSADAGGDDVAVTFALPADQAAEDAGEDDAEKHFEIGLDGVH